MTEHMSLHGLCTTKIWCTYIHSDREDLGENYLFLYWAGSVLGPIVYILTVVHALLWGYPSAVVGSIVSFDREWQI